MTPKNTGHGSRNAPRNDSFRATRERGGSFEGIGGVTARNPKTGEIVVWDGNPESPTYGHVRILTKTEARAYQKAARATGRRRRRQQLTRLLRMNR